MGVAHDDEGVRIDALHQLFHRDDIPPAEGAHYHLGGQVLVRPRAGQQCNAHVHLQQRPGDVLAAGADDEGQLGGLASIYHLIHEERKDIEHGDAVQHLGQLTERQRVGDDDHQIHQHTQLADGQLLEFQLQQPCDQLRTAGGRALAQHQPDGRAAQHAAVDHRQHRLQRLELVHGVDAVDHQGADGHRVQGADKHLFAQELQSQRENRDVQHQRHRAHRQGREKYVEHLGHAGQAADRHMLRLAAPAKAQRVQCTAGGDERVLLQRVGKAHGNVPPDG